MKILSSDILDKLSEFQRNNGLDIFGSKLSDYEVIGQLGRGATANVYRVRARNTSDD